MAHIAVRQLEGPNKTLIIYIEQGAFVHVVTISSVQLQIGGTYRHELFQRTWEELKQTGNLVFSTDNNALGTEAGPQSAFDVEKLISGLTKNNPITETKEEDIEYGGRP